MQLLLILFLMVPSSLLLLAVAILWLGSEAGRDRIGRPLARGAALAAGGFAALFGLLWIVTLGDAMRSLGNFQASVAIALFAGLQVVFGLTARRAARRGVASVFASIGVLGGTIVSLASVAFLVAAVARPRSTSLEAEAVAAVRAFLSAQHAYASLNGGFFDVPQCLARVDECVPAAPRGTAPLLRTSDLEDLRLGYRRRFIPGPKAPAEAVKRLSASPTSLTAFAYVVVPERQGEGLRAFCGTSNGTVCVRTDGTMDGAEDGRCPSDCEPLL